MEQKELNIAEILKDKPKDTKLWSDTFGEVKLKDVTIDKGNGYPIFLATKVYDETLYLDTFGRYYKNTDSLLPCIVPSKEMRDWKKFAWKKGDVLKAGVDNLCIFDSWESDNYTEFHAKFATPHYSGETFETKEWAKETNEDIIKQYISKIEEIKGGKFNFYTLEIEKPLQFKDGDIFMLEGKDTFPPIIGIYKTSRMYVFGTGIKVYVLYNGEIVYKEDDVFPYRRVIRYATEEERQRLFDALAKEGKQWDAEKKQIVDLPNEEKKCEFETFQKVLVRDLDTQAWKAGIFSCYNKDNTNNPYYCISNGDWRQCIPYNDQTKHLLGTTDDWKGGE